MRHEKVVVLTAAVTPSVQGPIAVADPGVRLAQYQRSIPAWVSLAQAAGIGLVVLETSGTYADRLTDHVPEAARGAVRVVESLVLPSEAVRGKGAAEFGAISRYLAGEGASHSFVYKGTGRLVVGNAAKLMRDLEPSEVVIRATLDRSFADTRFFGAGNRAWAFLTEALDEINDAKGVYAEHVLAGRLAFGAATAQLRVSRFAERPRIMGQSGSNGGVYKESWVRRLLTRPIARVEGAASKIAHRKQV